LAAGRWKPEIIGERVQSVIPAWVDEPELGLDSIAGVVITIDHFGNLLTNIEVALLERWVEPRVHIGQSILPLRRTYGDVAPGQPIALINSFGVVEIAVAEGRACDALGLSRGAPVVLRDAVGKR
jgi:S-adenosylmethionine hydrolase